MSDPQRLQDTSILTVVGDMEIFWERRLENNGDGNPIYIGYNRKANAPTAEESWFIVALEYTGTNLERYRLPDLGVGFKYAWDDRATLFS